MTAECQESCSYLDLDFIANDLDSRQSILQVDSVDSLPPRKLNQLWNGTVDRSKPSIVSKVELYYLNGQDLNPYRNSHTQDSQGGEGRDESSMTAWLWMM